MYRIYEKKGKRERERERERKKFNETIVFKYRIDKLENDAFI